MSIAIHILGPGYGESIVCELPDGSLGVIDSYAARLPAGRQGVPGFLRDRFPSRPLQFLAITHPHADHCGGLTELLDFDIAQLWVFDGVQSLPLASYYRHLAELRERDLVEEDLHVRPGTTLDGILRLNEEINNRVEGRSPGTFAILRSGQSFLLCDGEVRITCVTPGKNSCWSYVRRLAEAGAAAVQQTVVRAGGAFWARVWRGFRARRSERVPQVNHNLISAALLLEHGETTLLLMADAEEPLWEEWSQEGICRAELGRGVHLLKVAHHGSANGYFAELYNLACAVRSPLAVLTPFQRSRSPLPSTPGVDHLFGHVIHALCTNRAVTEDSSGYLWGATALPVGLPPAWSKAIRQRPELLQLLAPPYGSPAGVPAHLMLPPAWAYDCVRQPELNRFLHPELLRGGGGHGSRLAGGTLADYDEFRVSFYFDDLGNEEGRYRGPGAGTRILPKK
jgi:hypothetical protein